MAKTITAMLLGIAIEDAIRPAQDEGLLLDRPVNVPVPSRRAWSPN
jgi:hypothetical protein